MKGDYTLESSKSSYYELAENVPGLGRRNKSDFWLSFNRNQKGYAGIMAFSPGTGWQWGMKDSMGVKASPPHFMCILVVATRGLLLIWTFSVTLIHPLVLSRSLMHLGLKHLPKWFSEWECLVSPSKIPALLHLFLVLLHLKETDSYLPRTCPACHPAGIFSLSAGNHTNSYD